MTYLAKLNTIRMSVEWGLEVKFELNQGKKMKTCFDELCETERLNNARRYFKINVSNDCLNIILAQLSSHFHSLDAVVPKLNVILLKKLVRATDEELKKEAEKLVKQYNRDFSVALPGKLLACLTEMLKLLTEEDLAKV